MANPIGWCTKTWNPITGCTPVSPACDHCYARRMSHRLKGRFGYPADEPFRVTVHPERLEEPEHWRKPQRVFVGSMTDVFHPDIPAGFVRSLFALMDSYRQHTFLLLTKRPQYALAFAQGWGMQPWPRTIHLGVTAENQEMADERIPILLSIPAAVHWVSVEPCLEPIGLSSIPCQDGRTIDALGGSIFGGNRDKYGAPYYEIKNHAKLDWVVGGVESGPGKRACDPAWIKSLYEQCKDYGVPFFDKREKDPLAREFPR